MIALLPLPFPAALPPCLCRLAASPPSPARHEPPRIHVHERSVRPGGAVDADAARQLGVLALDLVGDAREVPGVGHR